MCLPGGYAAFFLDMDAVHPGSLPAATTATGREPAMRNVLPEEIVRGITAPETASDTMAFTGRRPKDLCGYDAASYRQSVADLAEILCLFYNNGVSRFISGGAQGFDQLAFWAVHRLKTRKGCADAENILYLPFRGQERRWAETGCFSQKEYRQMLSLADSVRIISGNNSIRALFDRNHAMVNDSGILLGLYPDDSWRTAKGGTAECLRYAVSCKRPVDVYQLKYNAQPDGLRLMEIVPITV